MKTALPEFDQIDDVELKLGGFTAKIRPEDLPPYLAWARGDGPNGHPMLLNRGVPFFVAAVDQQIWGRAHAVSGLEGIVLPQVRLALQDRARRELANRCGRSLDRTSSLETQHAPSHKRGRLSST